MKSIPTPFDILYDHVVRLTVRKLQTNITSSVKSDNGNISELTVVLMSKKCHTNSNYLLDVAFFVSFSTNTRTHFNAMIDYRVSELVSPGRIIDTDSYGKTAYTDMSGERYSVINTIDVKSCRVHSVKCEDIFTFFENIDNLTELVRDVFTQDNLKEYMLTSECIQCSDLYVSHRSTCPVLELSCKDLIKSDEDYKLCQKCEINYYIAKETGKIDETIPDKCCVCMEHQYPFNCHSLCSNPAHSIHRSCINRMSENGDTRCPLCRGRRDSEILNDDNIE